MLEIISVNVVVKKDNKYFVKMVPSKTTEFVSMEFLSDLVLKIDV